LMLFNCTFLLFVASSVVGHAISFACRKEEGREDAYISIY
jgi:hypothetical protein